MCIQSSCIYCVRVRNAATRCVYTWVGIDAAFRVREFTSVNFREARRNYSLNCLFVLAIQLTVKACCQHSTHRRTTPKMVLTRVVQSIRGWRKARRNRRIPRPISSSPGETSPQEPSNYFFRVEVRITERFVTMSRHRYNYRLRFLYILWV